MLEWFSFRFVLSKRERQNADVWFAIWKWKWIECGHKRRLVCIKKRRKIFFFLFSFLLKTDAAETIVCNELFNSPKLGTQFFASFRLNAIKRCFESKRTANVIILCRRTRSRAKCMHANVVANKPDEAQIRRKKKKKIRQMKTDF